MLQVNPRSGPVYKARIMVYLAEAMKKPIADAFHPKQIGL
jgi:hypothetical protein